MTEPHRILSLDPDTIQRIAAGEVVERPASVVKELVENSLDAGATRIEVAVERGGKDAIRVSDNGHGIPREQLPHALDEHATSKITDIDDLDSGVASLGFRGEALATIGAVSRLTIRSRPQGQDRGAELTVEGGDRGEIQPAGCPEGTTVEIQELFFNTPARKKFLKRDSTEFDHINTVVSQYALANPAVSISLSHNNRQLFNTEGGGSLRSAVLSVYGRDVAEAMINIECSADEPLQSISGLLSHPETTRSTREYLATFVNGRYVTDPALRGAVVDGYGGQLAADRYPFAVLFVEVPAESVDVNVHPRKTEVRFDNDEAVLSAISEAVETTLIEDGLIRSSAPRGRSAPAETPVVPGSSGRHEQSGEPAEQNAATNAEQPTASPKEEATSLGESSKAATTKNSHPDQTVAEPLDPADEDSWTVDGLGGTSSPTEPSAQPEADDAVGTDSTTRHTHNSTATEQPVSATDQSAAADTSNELTTIEMGEAKPVETAQTEFDLVAAQASSRSAGPTTQQTLSGDETTDRRKYDTLPTLSVLGQLYDTYLLAESDSGLVLIDQHAADERVNYERLQRAFAESPSSQRLAEPVELELTAREAALFEEYHERLNSIGFEVDHHETRTVEVTAVPAVFSTTLAPELLREAVVSFVESTDSGAETVEEAVDDLLADLACYPSVTGNTSLTEGSVVELLAALDDCANPYACPHGRPVIIELSREEIENRFERDYPGHSGRRAE